MQLLVERGYLPIFPGLPGRTRLFRRFVVHQVWPTILLMNPSILSVIDSYGIELIHPVREGRWEE